MLYFNSGYVEDWESVHDLAALPGPRYKHQCRTADRTASLLHLHMAGKLGKLLKIERPIFRPILFIQIALEYLNHVVKTYHFIDINGKKIIA